MFHDVVGNVIGIGARGENLGNADAFQEASELDEFRINRLYLLAKSWNSERYTAELLGNHQINSLYQFRGSLEAIPVENGLLLRTIVNDAHNLTPGWYWFRDLSLKVTKYTIFNLAVHDREAIVRKRAIEILKAADINQITDEFRVLDSIPSILEEETDEQVKIRQQKFSVQRQSIKARDARGSVLTANVIDYIGAKKARNWKDKLNGPPGKFLDN